METTFEVAPAFRTLVVALDAASAAVDEPGKAETQEGALAIAQELYDKLGALIGK